MAISKIVYKESPEATPVTWMDTTQKTVTAGAMVYGVTALGNDGTEVVGTLSCVTPEMFGAVGDGVTDDTTAWQSALTYGGLVLCRHSAEYLISDALRIHANTVIELNGCTINSNHGHLFYNFLDSDEFTTYNGNGNIVIRNGNINKGAISFIHGEHILFDNVHFTNSLNDHYLEICACKDFTIRNCSFIDMNTTSTSRKEYINIDNCNYSNFPWFTDTESPTYDGTIVDGVLIEDCYFDIGSGVMEDAIGKHAYYTSEDYTARRAKNITVKNCKIVGATEVAVLLLGVENVIVDSCIIENSAAIATCRNSINVSILRCKATGVTTYVRVENVSVFEFNDNNVETSVNTYIVNLAGTCNNIDFRNNRTVNSYGSSRAIRFYGAVSITGLKVFNNYCVTTNSYAIFDSPSSANVVQIEECDGLVFSSTSQTTTITNAYFNLTDFNVLLMQFGAVGDETYKEIAIKSFWGRNFLVGEVYKYTYVDTSDNVAIGTVTFTNANTLTITGLSSRCVVAQRLPRR